MAVFISFAAGAVNVNTLNRGSTISVGEVSQTGWSQNGKINYGNGQLFGCNLEFGFLTNLCDNDILDSPINEAQPSSTIQTQTP